jgi:hypothetical protein
MRAYGMPQVCRGCGLAYYCSPECAEADWRARHSVLCATAQARREEAEAGARGMEAMMSMSPETMFANVAARYDVVLARARARR